ncbi:hypothetical protein EVAR_60912_1 [Eumeta japonica]|uniref:Uncharacterized protein n=1 Tax=Eumeta variegata TaxID=151549 RepID=A0A4C1ZGJ6_EUMVA|nr:hypothetical protein EVAR_60912_1 [Eumeta japonica]
MNDGTAFSRHAERTHGRRSVAYDRAKVVHPQSAVAFLLLGRIYLLPLTAVAAWTKNVVLLPRRSYPEAPPVRNRFVLIGAKEKLRCRHERLNADHDVTEGPN